MLRLRLCCQPQPYVPGQVVHLFCFRAEVIVIDEIGTEAECVAARTIAQRGVQLIATAHGEGSSSSGSRVWQAGSACGWVVQAGGLQHGCWSCR